MKIYLDMCCYNRPYDDQLQIRISLETQAKIYIQNLIKLKKVDLVASYILCFENSQNPYITRKKAISDFLKTNTTEYVSSAHADLLMEKAKTIMAAGIKAKDALHIACAISLSCECFISTDDRLLKYSTNEIILINPIDFVKIWEENL